MARWIALKLVWLPRGILRYMVMIIMIPFLLSPRLLQFIFLWPLCSLSPLFQLDIKNVLLHGDLGNEV